MRAYRIAACYALLELAKNRLAMILLVCILPLWITMVRAVFTRVPVRFVLRSTGELITAGGEKISIISGSLNAVTLLIGFMMFSSARRAGAFDRRLVAAGYPRTALVLAKLTTLLAASAVVSGYATGWVLTYWIPRQPWLLAAGLFCGALVYGTLGLVLAVFLPGELEGMVVIIMASVLDLLPQNPLVNPGGHSALVTYLPSYGAMQTCIGAGFTGSAPWWAVARSLLWTVCLGLVSLLAFALRTRTYLRVGAASRGGGPAGAG